MKVNEETSNLLPVLSNVSQGSILEPFLYIFYSNNFSATATTPTVTFVDNIAIFVLHENLVIVYSKLHIN